MEKNVMIPLTLLERILDLLSGADTSSCGYEIRLLYDDVLWSLSVKKQKLMLHDAYGKIISAGSPDERDGARAEYFRLKRGLRDLECAIPREELDF